VDDSKRLRVLIANEQTDRLASLAATLMALGHDVIARETAVEDVGAATARERPFGAFEMLREQSRVANRKLIDPGRGGPRRTPAAVQAGVVAGRSSIRPMSGRQHGLLSKQVPPVGLASGR
jgi:hypothetical protein